MASWYSRLWLAAPTPEMEATYWESQRVNGLASWRIGLLGIAVLNLFWWGSDQFIYHGDPRIVEAVRPMRIATSSAAFGLWLLLPRFAILRRYWQGIITAAVMAVGTQIAWLFSSLGGPGTLWFPLTFPILIIPAAMSFRTGERIAVMLLFGVCFATGYYGQHPEHLQDPNAWTTISYLFFVVVVGSGGGLAAEYWRRDAFFLRLETKRQADLLAGMNGQLETRVAEQTSELRLLARNLESARETERAHIARELHDELGQQLTGLRYALKFTQVRYDREPLTIQSNLRNLQEVLNQLSTTTRELVRELRPKVLDDLGLVSAVEWLVKGFGDRTGTRATLSTSLDSLPLDREANVAAFRMVQEALTNIAKHSQAKNVVVTIATESDAVLVRVTDDGVGFAPSSAADKGGSGLIGMRERLRAVGGELQIESAPGQGATLTARLAAQRLELTA